MRNKRILITGASKGLGAVAAHAFAERGARLVLVARSRDKLEQVRRTCKDPEGHFSIPVNFLEIKEILPVVHQAKEFLGGIDVVLHAGGGGLGLKEDLLMHEGFWERFALNVGGGGGRNGVGGAGGKPQNAGMTQTRFIIPMLQ